MKCLACRDYLKKNLRILFGLGCLFLFWMMPPVLAESSKGTDESDASYEKLVRQNVQLRQDFKELNDKYQSLESERTLLLTRLKELQTQNDTLHKPANLPENIQADVAILRERLTNNINKLEDIIQDRDRLRKSLEEARQRVGDIDQTVAKEVEKKVKETQGNKAALLKALQEEKAQQEAETQSLKKQLEEALARENALKSKAAAFVEAADLTREQGESGMTEGGEMSVKEAPDGSAKISKKQIKAYHKELKKLQKELEKTEKSLAVYTGQKEQLRQKILFFQDEVKKKQLKFHFNTAIQLEEKGLHHEALREYLTCLEIDPTDADTHYNLGILYDDKLNLNSAAVGQYQLYLKYCPRGENVWQVKNWILLAEEEARLGASVR